MVSFVLIIILILGLLLFLKKRRELRAVHLDILDKQKEIDQLDAKIKDQMNIFIKSFDIDPNKENDSINTKSITTDTTQVTSNQATRKRMTEEMKQQDYFNQTKHRNIDDSEQNETMTQFSTNDMLQDREANNRSRVVISDASRLDQSLSFQNKKTFKTMN